MQLAAVLVAADAVLVFSREILQAPLGVSIAGEPRETTAGRDPRSQFLALG